MSDSLKFQKWCKAFLDPQSETYANATKSALATYKTKRYYSAASIGHQNFKRLQNQWALLDEQEGMGPLVWMKVAAKKAMDGSLNDVITWMRELGYLEKPTTQPANQINQQFNFADLMEKLKQTRRERGLSTTPTKYLAQSTPLEAV